jgi:hypothetical protein
MKVSTKSGQVQRASRRRSTRALDVMSARDADALFFIRMRLPEGELAQNFTWSLFVVKVSTDVTAYVAFRTEDLAQMVVADCSRSMPTEPDGEYSLSVVGASVIDANHYFDFDAKPVVLFETKAEVDAVLTRPPSYPYEQHLHRFSPTTGLRQLDV